MDFRLTDEQLLQKIVDAPKRWRGRVVLVIATKLNGKPFWLDGE